MRSRDLSSSLFWIAFGLIFIIGGLKHGLTRQGIPGPGALPFLVGFILTSLSLVILIPSLFRKLEKGDTFSIPKDSLRKAGLALFALMAYAFLLKPLGFFLTTLIFLIFVLRFIEPQKWRTVLTFSFLTAFGAYLIFASLQVELPKGFCGI
jgi:uncharacterized protein YjeT (DUF2065 family)